MQGLPKGSDFGKGSDFIKVVNNIMQGLPKGSDFGKGSDFINIVNTKI